MADGQTGLLLLISGPSGVGKDTIIREFMTARAGMKHSISMTTRPPRGDEIEAVDYYFTDRETFERMIEKGEMLEHDVYCGHYYGTPAAPVREMIAAGTDVLLDITIQGAIAIMEIMPEAISIFLLPPSLASLEQRLQMRGTETKEAIAGRLEQAMTEIGHASAFDYVVVNEHIPDTISTIQAIYVAERHRSERLEGIEEKIISGEWHA